MKDEIEKILDETIWVQPIAICEYDLLGIPEAAQRIAALMEPKWYNPSEQLPADKTKWLVYGQLHTYYSGGFTPFVAIYLAETGTWWNSNEQVINVKCYCAIPTPPQERGNDAQA